MKKVKKWDFENHRYEEVEISDDCLCYCEDMNRVVECPNCGKKLLYGDAYTSLQYHTDNGFGYAVCNACYREEMKRKIDEDMGY